MISMTISGVALVCSRNAEKSALGHGAGPMGWSRPSGFRPRPDAHLTLDPTQRPSAPRRWAPDPG